MHRNSICLLIRLSALVCVQSISSRLRRRSNMIEAESVFVNSTSHSIDHVTAESRIVGGDRVSPGDYPYFVEWQDCGATLIHNDILLSAAHCHTIRSNSVLIGAYVTGTIQTDAEYRTITTRHKHPYYDETTDENDFLIIKINEPSTKLPILLNDQGSRPYDNEELTVLGFGALREGGFFGSLYLQEVTVNAIPHDRCNEQYSGSIMEEVMLCAGVPDGGKDSCHGDSGGPIIDSDGVQVGVVSWGKGCGRSDYPGVYSRISGAIDWIKEQICELSDTPPVSCNSSSLVSINPPANNGYSHNKDDDGDNSTVHVQISLVLDDYPQETGIILTDITSTTTTTNDSNNNNDVIIIIDHPIGTFSIPELYTEVVHLPLGGEYELLIKDSWGDGLCCRYGLGSVEVYATYPNDGEKEEEHVLLAKSNGQFGARQILSFVVPPPPLTSSSSSQDIVPPIMDDKYPSIIESDSPLFDVHPPSSSPPPIRNTDTPTTISYYEEIIQSSSPTTPSSTASVNDNTSGDSDSTVCIDSLSGRFAVTDLNIGYHHCHWLSNNMGQYSNLCNYYDIAMLCRKTCNVCT